MNDGTTPLILAARLAVEGMVAELINCQADVNAVDDHGRDEKQGFRLLPAKQASEERIIARSLKSCLRSESTEDSFIHSFFLLQY